MLPLTTPLLAALLGQVCPPITPNSPPPCAAANVPGCIPGYRAERDRSGHVFYVCDAQSAPRSASNVSSPPYAVVPAKPAASSQPAPYYVTPNPPQAASAVPPPPPENRGHIGLVFMPGVAAFPHHHGFDDTKPEGQVALEFRGSEGGGRLRLTAEYTSFGRIGEMSFKYNLFDEFFFRPWFAIGAGVASINPDPAVRASGSASVGLDLFLTRDFFLTGELKGRIFTEGTRGPAHGLVISDRKQTSALAGIGIYFF